MSQSSRARGPSEATIEHFNNDGPFDKKYSLAICCRRCNSSRRDKSLSDWFKREYCLKNKINEKTVAKPVKEFLRLKKRS